VFGPAGSSKTTGWLNIAKFAHLTKSPSHFYVIDTDFAVDRMLTGYPDLPNVTVYPVFDWREYTSALSQIRARATPDDWVVVDFISNAWSAVQEHYVEQVFHRDMGEYFLQVRKDLDKSSKSLGALEGWVDWQVINPLYKKWANDLLYRGKYHLYCTAKVDNLSSERAPTESPQTRQLFARYQVKPVGQKDLPFQFHTVLLTGRSGADWTITTIKDRERQEVSSLTVHNFTNEYLIGVAKWSLV